MKKGILCILLSLFLLTPLFTACSEETVITETEVSIYTLYTICEESTTDEAVRQVELALNRILFYRLGVVIDLHMVTEEEYDKLIEDKFAEMDAYQEAQLEMDDFEDEDENAEAVDVITGDEVIEMLENGQDIVLDEPRFDIFLVRGYDKYYELATSGKLTQLDSKLSNEAKAIKAAIHSTIFTAALVNGATYGIPVNSAIGEYTYLAFDEELINKYSIDPNTIKSMEDLENYLEVIKENEPGVVPLMNTIASKDISFLLNDGFPAVVNKKGEVVNAYTDDAVRDYLAMIARYNTLGYLGSDEDSDDTRYAVRIETGTTTEIDTRLADTGYSYDYSLFSAPIATNETSFENIFCVSNYVLSDELIDIAKLLTALNTNAELMNLLTYGVENEHYVLTDEGQVSRINSNYVINPKYAGNSFITYTLEGEDPNKWNDAIQQNQDAYVSPSLGFTFNPMTFTYFETVGDEDIMYTVAEPNYVDIINSVIDKYYPSLMAGNAAELDYETLLAEVTAEVNTEFTERIDDLYAEKNFFPAMKENALNLFNTERAPVLLADVTATVRGEYKATVITNLTATLTTEYTTANPDATEDEIAAMLETTLTDAYVEEHIADYFTEEEIQLAIEAAYATAVEEETAALFENLTETDEYKQKLAELQVTEAYLSDLNAILTYDAPTAIMDRFEERIATVLTTYFDSIVDELDTELETAGLAFVEEYAEKLDHNEDSLLLAMNYNETKLVPVDPDADPNDPNTEMKEAIVRKYSSWFEFVLKERIASNYYKLFGEPTAE